MRRVDWGFLAWSKPGEHWARILWQRTVCLNVSLFPTSSWRNATHHSFSAAVATRPCIIEWLLLLARLASCPPARPRHYLPVQVVLSTVHASIKMVAAAIKGYEPVTGDFEALIKQVGERADSRRHSPSFTPHHWPSS
jgi:hypothetical protein